MNIVVDTREQNPYPFRRWKDEVYVTRDTLRVGDYSLDSWQDYVTVERKDIQDFFRSIGKDRERFIREMELLSCFAWKLLVVEGDMESCMEASHTHKWTRLTTSQVWGTVTVFLADLQIPVVFSGSRNAGEEVTFRFLRRVQTKLHHYDNLPIMPVVYQRTYTACSSCGKTRLQAILERPDLGVREWVRLATKLDQFGEQQGNTLAVCYSCREKIAKRAMSLPEGFAWQK